MANECILIDRERLRFLKRTPTVRQAEYWAALLCKDRDFVIQGPERRHFAAFSMLELGQLYYQTVGGAGGTINGFDEAVKLCATVAERLPLDDTPEDELEEKLGRKLPPTQEAGPLRIPADVSHYSIIPPPEFGSTGRVEAKPGKGKTMVVTVTEQPHTGTATARTDSTKPSAANTPKAPKAPRAPAQPGNRPASGTSTGKVWDLADKLAKGVKDVASKEFRTKVVEACVKEGINQSTAGVQFGKWKASR